MMAKVALSTTFQKMPEGEHVLKITSVEYDENFMTAKIKFKSAEGYTHNEQYSMLSSDGEINEGALGAFSYLVQCALNDPLLSEVDPVTLKDKYIKATAKWDDPVPSKKKPGEFIQYVHISNIKAATEADFIAASTQKTTPAPVISQPATPRPSLNIGGMFGGGRK